jgi:hypothetical protein
MAFDYKAALKKPWVKYALIGIAVLGAVFIIRARSSSSSSSGASADPSSSAVDAATVQANAQLSAQQQALAASSAAQTSQQQFQLAALQETDKTQLAALTETNSHSLSLANIQLQGLHDQLAEKSHEADLSAGVATNNVNQQASVAKNTSKNSTYAAVAGTVAMAAIALF